MKQEKTVNIRFKWLVVICSLFMFLVIIGGGFSFWKSQDNKKKAELTELQNSFAQQVGATSNVQFGKQPDIYWATFTQDGDNYLLEYIGGVWKVVVKVPVTPTPSLTPVPTTEPTPTP
jgi:hypothetical protein